MAFQNIGENGEINDDNVNTYLDYKLLVWPN